MCSCFKCTCRLGSVHTVGVHEPWTRVSYTGVILDTRVCGPCSRAPVDTTREHGPCNVVTSPLLLGERRSAMSVSLCLSVCLYVCLSVHISQQSHLQTLRSFTYMLTVTVIWSSSYDVMDFRFCGWRHVCLQLVIWCVANLLKVTYQEAEPWAMYGVCDCLVCVIIGSRPSDHYFRSVCWFVCLPVCLFVQSFSQPSLIRFRSN